MQLLIGLLVFHETMEPARWAGTAIVWVALVVLGVDWVGSAPLTEAHEGGARADGTRTV